MIKQSIFVATALSIALLFLSCTTPQDVLNDYNKHFEKTPAVTQDILETGNAALMLQELYKVDIEHTLVLSAPLGCESYEWKIADLFRYGCFGLVCSRLRDSLIIYKGICQNPIILKMPYFQS